MSDIKIDKILDLSKIFRKLEDKSYCIIKLPDIFPSYSIGSDLDIFCYDIQEVSQIIVSSIQEYITKNVTVELIDNKTHIYIDVIQNDKIHFRFDLYGALPLYNNVSIKDAFFSSVVENTKIVSLDDLNIKVPSDIDEAILRYIEYHEWYVKRPDKIKHIQYLEDKIEKNEISINKMFDKLHYYISIPRPLEDRAVSSSESVRYIQYLYGNIQKIIKYIQINGFKKTFTKVKSKVL